MKTFSVNLSAKIFNYCLSVSDKRVLCYTAKTVHKEASTS